MDVSEIYLHCYEGGSETAQPQVFSFPHLLARLRRSLPGQHHHYHHWRFDLEVFFFIKNAFDTSVISIIIISTTSITIITTMNNSQASVSVDCPRGLTSRCHNFPLNIMIHNNITEVLFFLYNCFFVNY